MSAPSHQFGNPNWKPLKAVEFPTLSEILRTPPSNSDRNLLFVFLNLTCILQKMYYGDTHKHLHYGWSLIFASDHNTITTMMINKPITGFLNQTFNTVQI